MRAAESQIRVACVGDSITAGYKLSDRAHDAYPAQLARLLGEGWNVRNFGVSSATLTRNTVYPYDQRPAYTAVLGWKPDIVVIALGTNDSRPDVIGARPNDFIPSYHALLAALRGSNPKALIFLCLPPPIFPVERRVGAPVPPQDERALQQDILPRIRSIAQEEGLSVIDLHEALKADAAFFPDSVHPTAEGAAVIAEQVYGALMVATQPHATSLEKSVNTAVMPVPRLDQDCYNWWTRHAEALDAGARLKPEVVLIGDSITHFWAGEPRSLNRLNGPRAWAATFGSRRVLNLGFGWDRTQNVLWRLDHGEFDGLDPKLVIVNVGTNNFVGTANARANTPEEVAAGVLAICERVRQKRPAAHLLVMGVFPRGYQPALGHRAQIRLLNSILDRDLAGIPNTTFLDIGSRFLAPDGSLPSDVMPDATHPSEKGYEIWGRAIVETGLLP